MFLSLIFLLLVQVEGCYIWGTDSGTCSTDTLDPLWRLANMPYCADAIQYPACIPTYQVRCSLKIIVGFIFDSSLADRHFRQVENTQMVDGIIIQSSRRITGFDQVATLTSVHKYWRSAVKLWPHRIRNRVVALERFAGDFTRSPIVKRPFESYSAGSIFLGVIAGQT